MALAKNLFNFTQKSLKTLPPASEGKRDVYFDSREKGLNLIVTDKGNKSFYVRKVIKGQSKRIRLGAFPDLSVENAREMALKVKNAVALGDDPHQAHLDAKAELTFSRFFLEEYLPKHAQVYKKTYKSDNSIFEKYLVSSLGNKKLSDVKNEDIRLLHQRIGCSAPYSANRVFALIRVVFNKAIEWNFLKGENPTRFIKPFKEHSRDRFLQSDEIPPFFEALNEESNSDIRDYVFLSLWTGARKMNVLSMRWSDINFQNKVWRIPVTKNGDAQILPLVDEAVSLLEERKKSLKYKKYVFPSDSRTGHLVEPKRAWKRICQSATIKYWQRDEYLADLVSFIKCAEHGVHTTNSLFQAIQEEAIERKIELPKGLIDLRLHDLRRTLGSFQASLGVSLSIIGKSLGHKSYQSTQVYSRLSVDPVRNGMQLATSKISSHIMGGSDAA